MVINKAYGFVKDLVISSNLVDNQNNLHIQNAFLHNSQGLHPVNRINDLWGDYLKVKGVKGAYYSENSLMFRIYEELDDYFTYDTIYLATRYNKFMFVIKLDEVISQKTIIQEGLINIDKDIKIL